MGPTRSIQGVRHMYLQVAATTAGLVLCGFAHAATPVPTTATFAVSATVVAGCMVVGSPTQTSGIGFGMLDFGTHPAVLGANINASMGLSGGSMAQIQCTSG